ncbi:MAG: DNA polymerase III subunit beta [Desulfovibrionaceae bacterium]|nr:DNA polymerase III subunit beta [Desulfovibrionaceae bacterium]
MDVLFKKEDIMEGVQKAYNIIPSKVGNYLRSIWIQAEDYEISIMATDASIEFKGSYPIQTASTFFIGVPSKSFVELLRKLSLGDVCLEIEENKKTLTVKQGKGKYALPVADQMWFQPFTPFPEELAVTWLGYTFKDAIDKLYFCIADEDTIEGINCLSIKPVGSLVELCGLNGHQLAVLQIEHEALAQALPPEGILVHKKYIVELKKMLPETEIDICFQNNRLHTKALEVSEHISLPISAYSYPEYKHFLDKLHAEGVSTLKAPRKAVMDCLEKISIFNTESNRCVYLQLTQNTVLFSVQGFEVGTGEEEIEVEYTGSIEKIAFPTKNLIEILSKFTSETITFLFTSIEGPCGIVGDDDAHYTVIIMPMKIAEK